MYEFRNQGYTPDKKMLLNPLQSRNSLDNFQINKVSFPGPVSTWQLQDSTFNFNELVPGTRSWKSGSWKYTRVVATIKILTPFAPDLFFHGKRDVNLLQTSKLNYTRVGIKQTHFQLKKYLSRKKVNGFGFDSGFQRS